MALYLCVLLQMEEVLFGDPYHILVMDITDGKWPVSVIQICIDSGTILHIRCILWVSIGYLWQIF